MEFKNMNPSSPKEFKMKIAMLEKELIEKSQERDLYAKELQVLWNLYREKVKEDAKKIAERVREIVAETRFPNENFQPNGDLTVSIGVGTFSPSISTLTDLIREADNALYRAKGAGRNRVEG